MVPILLVAASCLAWTPSDLRAVARQRGPWEAGDTMATPVADERVCARLARVLGMAGTPVFAARVGCYYVAIPQAPGTFGDELYILDARFNRVPASAARGRACVRAT